MEVLSPVAQWLLEHYDVTILLVEGTARDMNSDYALSLSSECANDVRDSMISISDNDNQSRNLKSIACI